MSLYLNKLRKEKRFEKADALLDEMRKATQRKDYDLIEYLSQEHRNLLDADPTIDALGDPEYAARIEVRDAYQVFQMILRPNFPDNARKTLVQQVIDLHNALPEKLLQYKKQKEQQEKAA